MATACSIIILELWLYEDSSIFNLCLNCIKKTGKNCSFFITEGSCWFWIFNDFDWVACITENSVNIAAEIGVVDQTVTSTVFINDLLQFALMESEIQCAKACSELYKETKNLNCNWWNFDFNRILSKNKKYLRLPLQLNLFSICRNQWKILSLWFYLWQREPVASFQHQAPHSYMRPVFTKLMGGNCWLLK